ncbi:hypothetical protein BSFA1_45740 [Burkholderia sp. SFA1]|uniref:hypothetical protein n=1 Tax=Caballeronia sp. CLC5 TaxID=2906764 RepID=UPI001F3B273D|nr:hypothetical protein [Caballeronia sp. CLC5]MCE4574066.1 hypothetical protein [Caballeronia sp. CLC5]BBP99445.1 hypothetical protein BSFA1_45740 [Burkholderia sp. SFA1]
MKHCLAGALLALFAVASFADDGAHHANSRPVRVFDANGQAIGDLTSFSAQNGVAFTAGDATAVVPITRVQDASFHFSATDFQWLAVSSGQFTSTDCSGDPVILSIWGPRFAIPFRRGSEVTVYFAAPGPEQALTVRSALGASPGTCNQFASPFTIMGYPAAAKRVITRDHPEPLSIGY